jgi:hypothetical protein
MLVLPTQGAMVIDEVRFLAALCRELAQRGLDVGMSDAKPALSVRPSRGNALVWISVDRRGGVFEWCRTRRHSLADPAGAADVIAAEICRGTRKSRG